MLETIAAAQAPVLVLLLTLGGVAKAATAHADVEPGGLVRLGPAILMPPRWRTLAMYVCAAVELVMAAGLIFSTHPYFRWNAVVFFALSTYVLMDLRRRHPDAGCGCFGEVSSRPIGMRSIGRTVVLTAMSVGVVWAPVPALSLLAEPDPLTLTGAAAGLAVLAVLSPELEEVVARLRYRAPCEQRSVPTGVALARLRSSAAWRAHESLLLTDQPRDSWRELCWRFFVYPGRTADGRDVEVVFAVYLSGRRPPVKVALVDEDGTAVQPMPESTPVSAAI
ncbi:MauE/DoxX family redox-associated membrane protein [Thermostaphylospora chromogena]|uniref:Methylamine utilisation protein MauE n=1 Tax=Thermostaphylospora chromogena TaxID=35622 RepID=A0A1H1CXE4_9ACTN|nr:MauE/DoxX family redox-associated membrane protein [Thermostaphylospora chromogena]SDQ68800.1 Methylamine utilisation protein MauE [Thermostaphylospora chromogena]